MSSFAASNRAIVVPLKITLFCGSYICQIYRDFFSGLIYATQEVVADQPPFVWHHEFCRFLGTVVQLLLFSFPLD